MYSLDTSFLMDWQARYYPLDLFPGLSARVEAMIADKRCHAVDLVREELDAVGTPDLKAWAASHAGLFLPLSPDVQVEAATIEARYPDLHETEHAAPPLHPRRMPGSRRAVHQSPRTDAA
jgi:hypothetical protein